MKRSSTLSILRVVAVIGFMLMAGWEVRAEELGRLTVTEENDKFLAAGDKHYTQGFRASWLTTPVESSNVGNGPYTWLSHNLPVFGGDTFKRRYEWTILGQSLFTPSDTQLATPQPDDRPYGAWLYTGVSLLQETEQSTYTTLENMEVQLGVAGPMALGSVMQNDWHQLIGVAPARGWTNQIHNEPGLVLSYERKWRFEHPVSSHLAIDVIPEVGGSLGNIFTYQEVGGLLRIGKNLGADYGPSRIRPALSGTGWFNADRLNGPFGWYIFVGTQGRLVERNIFLDGNSFRPSQSVDRSLLVADFMAGASIFWGQRARVDFTAIQRTPEFETQHTGPDRFAGVNFVLGF
ncbi:MAG: lipid A deacylase LpxR family protein [Alphaproteobacteria bacterium]|nr:lipid A deacylase LpxR family protein [Alphaproteobacteria bacterium]